MVIPGATIYTLMDFMREPSLIRPYLSRLEETDPTAAAFLETQLFSSSFDGTRQQILYRLWNVLSTSRALERMFAHRHNRLDMFAAMNEGSLILINTTKEYLQKDACEIFGKFMIALITQATLERATPGAKRTPTFVYIDEAQEYFGEGQGLEDLLNQARKYQVGLILAHQNLGQCDRKLKQSLMSSTAVKFVGGVSSDDAKELAPNMATAPEMLMEMRKQDTDTRFALYVKDQTPQAIEFSIPLGTLEKRPQMSAAAYEDLLAENRTRISAPADRELFRATMKEAARAAASFDLEEAGKI
jgi:hypothetical protein